jgi:hypothetical protein
MRFHSEITVARSSAEVAAFFDDPQNLVRCDKSVARIEIRSAGPAAVGFTFDTIAPSGMRMTYRIAEHEAQRRTTIELISASMFKRAVWCMTYDSVPGGVRIGCAVDFRLRVRYALLIIPLVMRQRSALRRDLLQLKDAIERAYPRHAN